MPTIQKRKVDFKYFLESAKVNDLISTQLSIIFKAFIIFLRFIVSTENINSGFDGGGCDQCREECSNTLYDKTFSATSSFSEKSFNKCNKSNT